MRTVEEITQTVNNRISAGVMPELDTQEKINAYIQQEINQEARTYLAQTDWYVIRFLETGVDVPEQITADRELARSSIVE